MTEKEELYNKFLTKEEELEQTVKQGIFAWCLRMYPVIYRKVMDNSDLDNNWEVWSTEEFKNYLNQKYQAIKYVITLYKNQGGNNG